MKQHPHNQAMRCLCCLSQFRSFLCSVTLLSVPGQPGKHPAWLSAEEKSLSVLYEGQIGASNSCTEGRRCLLDFGRAGGGLMPLRGIVREGRLSLPGGRQRMGLGGALRSRVMGLLLQLCSCLLGCEMAVTFGLLCHQGGGGGHHMAVRKQPGA